MSATIETLKLKIAANMATLETLNTINQPRQYATPEERQEFKNVEYKADSVLKEFGTSTSRLMEPRAAESPFQYRRRVLQRIAAETKQHRNIDYSSVPPSDFLELETKIYADALVQSRHPLDLAPGQIREIKKMEGYKEISEFRVGGGPGAFQAVYGHCIAPPMGYGTPCRNADADPEGQVDRSTPLRLGAAG